MKGALTIAMLLRIGEELERSRQASSAPALFYSPFFTFPLPACEAAGTGNLIRGIQFLISIPGGSEQLRCSRTNLGIEMRGPVRRLNLVPPGAHDGWMQGALTIAMPLRIGEELEPEFPAIIVTRQGE